MQSYVQDFRCTPISDPQGQIGGEDGLCRLVRDFDDFVESTPEGQSLQILHVCGDGIPLAELELFDFLSGFIGRRRH